MIMEITTFTNCKIPPRIEDVPIHPDKKTGVVQITVTPIGLGTRPK